MIFKDHFDYRGKAAELKVERAVRTMEGFIRKLFYIRHQLVMLGYLRRR